MAERAQSVAENAPGVFFVDSTCIDCDTCRQLAPATFADAGEHSYVRIQPRDEAEARSALRALVSCPTASIGTSDNRGTAVAAGDFPLELDRNLYYCGFNSHKSFGANSYFVEDTGGNWLIDSPRYVERLASRLEERGGIRFIFLTHRDDVADAKRWAARFGSIRIIHRLELKAQPGAERVIEGFDPVELAPGFLAIPTPGHTPGHTVLLYRERFLFTGDHLSWNREERRLSASRDYCWYSWREQVESLAKLQSYRFEWVLPGHGQRVRLSRDQIHYQMARLMDRELGHQRPRMMSVPT
jgi:glyoxylase-like metal-dependent hydrolase (beta-lactamase superfamily II)/ferredoxin